MTYFKKLLMLMVFVSASLVFGQKAKVVISMDGFENNKGLAQVAVYRASDTFLSEQPYMACSAEIVGLKSSCEFQLPPGNYAVAVLHDVNKNKKMDKNLLGIPLEAYGFSRNVKPALRAPTFDETKFRVNGNTTINISLK